MFKIPVGVKHAEVSLISDDKYYDVVTTIVRKAYKRISASLFLIDLNTKNEYTMMIHDLFIDLKNAMWEGSDVRLIVSGSKNNMLIAQSAMTAYTLANKMGIPCLTPMTTKANLSHAKYVVADDFVLLGSHNWSPGALSTQTQDSVLIKSPEYASYCNYIFDKQWKNIKL